MMNTMFGFRACAARARPANAPASANETALDRKSRRLGRSAMSTLRVKWPASLPRLAPRVRQVPLRREQDLKHRLPVRFGEVGKLFALVFPRQDRPEPRINLLLEKVREPIEALRVNEIAARILEHPRRQIEVPKRPPLPVFHP